MSLAKTGQPMVRDMCFLCMLSQTEGCGCYSCQPYPRGGDRRERNPNRGLGLGRIGDFDNGRSARLYSADRHLSSPRLILSMVL
jgi:hypothetical protein